MESLTKPFSSRREFFRILSDLFDVRLADKALLAERRKTRASDLTFNHCDPQIEKIDEANYGRVIFSYRARYYKGSDSNICFSALIICQASSNNEVLYYEDVCYIVKEQVNYTPEPDKEFDAEVIDYLKSINDWNKELDLEKCL